MNAILVLLRPAVLGLALAMLAACSSGDGNGKPSAPAASPATEAPAAAAPAPPGAATPGCNLLPPSEAASALGIPTLLPPESTVSGIVTVCVYSDGHYPRSLTLRFQKPTDASQFKMGKDNFVSAGQPVEGLKGLADDAYTSTLGSGKYVSHSVVFLTKDLEVMVTSSQPLDKLEALARVVLAKL